MPLEIDGKSIRIIGNNFKGLKFYDDSRVLRQEIYLQFDNTLNIGTTSSGGSSTGDFSVHAIDGSLHSGLLSSAQAPQFLLISGGRAMTGDLDMGTHAITNVGNVDGVDVSGHAARHANGGGDAVDHDTLTNFVANEHINHTSVTLSAGDGLTGGGDISANRTFAISNGSGIAFSSGAVYAYALCQSGYGDLALEADANGDMTSYGSIAFDVAESITTNAGNLTIAPAGDIVFDPGGADLLPLTGYELNIGSVAKKYLTIHAAELWIQNLVAQDTVATVGGRIVIPKSTTQLVRDLSNTNLISNGGFETAGAGDPDFFANWTETAGDGAIADETVIVNGGSHSAKLTYGAGVATNIRQSFTVVPELQYTLVFHTRGDGTVGGRYQVYDFTNSASIIATTATGVTGTDWTQIRVSFTAPADCVTAIVYLHMPASAGSAYFDDVYVWNSTIYVKHNSLADGDILWMESGGSVEFFEVLAAAVAETDGYSYATTRDIDGSGVTAWYAGDAVVNTGDAGDGFIDLYSVSGIADASTTGPTIVGNVRNSATYNDWTEHWAIGNLDGLFGYGTTTYGVGLGKYGTSHMTIDPTNGIQMFSGANRTLLIQPDGDVIFGKVATDNANLFWDASEGTISLRGGTDGTAVGVYIDVDGGLVFNQGSGTNNRIKWGYGDSNLGVDLYGYLVGGVGVSGSFASYDTSASPGTVVTRLYTGQGAASYAMGLLYVGYLELSGSAAIDLRVSGGIVVGSTSIDPEAGAIRFIERSSDPAEPAEGEAVLWMSNGSGKGDDGDVLIASKAGGTTNYSIIFDHSAGTGW